MLVYSIGYATGYVLTRRSLPAGGAVTAASGFVANALRLPLVAQEEQRLSGQADTMVGYVDAWERTDVGAEPVGDPIDRRREREHAGVPRP